MLCFAVRMFSIEACSGALSIEHKRSAALFFGVHTATVTNRVRAARSSGSGKLTAPIMVVVGGRGTIARFGSYTRASYTRAVTVATSNCEGTRRRSTFVRARARAHIDLINLLQTFCTTCSSRGVRVARCCRSRSPRPVRPSVVLRVRSAYLLRCPFRNGIFAGAASDASCVRRCRLPRPRRQRRQRSPVLMRWKTRFTLARRVRRVH